MVPLSCGSSGVMGSRKKASTKCSQSANGLKVRIKKLPLKTGITCKILEFKRESSVTWFPSTPKFLPFVWMGSLFPWSSALQLWVLSPLMLLRPFPNFLACFFISWKRSFAHFWLFFQALDIPEKQPGKTILLNPRLISYSIVPKLSEIVDFLASFGLDKEGMIGKVLVKYPFLMGYSVDKRQRPTLEFLKSMGLKDVDVQAVAVGYPEVLCRDANKVLRPILITWRTVVFKMRR